MYKHSFTKQRGKPIAIGFRGVLAAMLLGSLFFASGARAGAMHGIYTIDPSGSGNYTNFALAVKDLKSNGISSSVEFDVAAGTYNESVSVGTITGTAATNTITFKGAGRTKTILTFSTGTVVTLGKYTFFDGMTISSTSTSYYLINAGNSTDCGISNSNLLLPISNVTTDQNIYAYNANSLTIYNNYVQGGYMAIYAYGQDYSTTPAVQMAYGNGRYTHNRFIGQYEYCYYDIETYNDSFAFNTIDSSDGQMQYDIFQELSDNVVIWGNKVYSPASQMAYLVEPDNYPITGHSIQSYTVNNWFVAQTGGSVSYIVYDDVQNVANYTNAFNSIYDADAVNYAMFCAYSNDHNLTFADNMVYCSNTNVALYMQAYNGTTFAKYDGNCLYSAGTFAEYYNGSTTYGYGSYAAYQSGVSANGWDIHGTSVVPPFVSLKYPADLHMSTTAAAPKGVNCGIKIDMDGKGRFPIPTAGADESYFGVVSNNLAVTTLLSPIGQCPGKATVSVAVANIGLTAINGYTIAWNWNGTPMTSVTSTDKVALYGTDTLVLGTVTMSAGVIYTVKAWPTMVNTNSTAVANAGGVNDTLSQGGIRAALVAGTYTIDGTAATSGTNFKTFTDAATAINAGICGPIVFNVSAATYTESVNINNFLGTSAKNTVIFRGAGRTKTTLTSSGAPLTLAGNHVTFDMMSIITTGSGNVVSAQGANYSAFTNDNLTAPAYPNNSGQVIGVSATGFKVNNCELSGGFYIINVGGGYDTFTNNRLINMGYYGIYANATYGNDYEHNVLDSVAYSSAEFGIYSYNESGGIWNANYFNFRSKTGAASMVYYPAYLVEPNYIVTTVGSSSTPLTWSFTNNVIQASSVGQYGVLYEPINAQALDVFAFNTIQTSGGPYGVYIPIESNKPNTEVFASNIIQASNAQYGIYIYPSTPGVVSGIPQWNNVNGKGGDALWDGNDVMSTGSTTAWGEFTNNPITSYTDYITACQGINPSWENHGTNILPNYLNSGQYPLALDTTKAGPEGVNVCVPVNIPGKMSYQGVQYDLAGRKRCPFFPTAGAFEDPYGKNTVATKIILPPAIYPGSPATVYQSHTATAPASYIWFIKNANYSTWTPLSTALDLYYNGWTTGTDSLKLVTVSCQGTDSDEVGFKITAPTTTPTSDFIAASNTIQQGTTDQFTDLSSEGPIKWGWTVTPDSISVGGLKYPTTNLAVGSPALGTTQNPNIEFDYSGEYEVCLTAYNGQGRGTQTCKMNYIEVVPAINLSDSLQTMTTSTGYIFDNGGPSANYNAVTKLPYLQSVLIRPCADSVYLTFSQFDTKCGYDYVRLYNGSDESGIPLWGNCNGNGNGYGPGFTGGPTNLCTNECIPNVNKPDTFKAGKTMYLTMDCVSGGAPGFSAYYWIKPSVEAKVMPSFTTATGDTVCAGQIVNYQNTTPIDPKDVPSFEWDLNGDLTDGFECVGTCATALWPYFLPGTVPVTLIAINCGGEDTIVKVVTIITAPKPVAAFSASIISPTLSDVDVLTSNTKACVENYKWTITASAGTAGGAAATFVNGTSSTSVSPQVTFPDTGYYDVSLYVDNSATTQTNTLTKKMYIHVRAPYCVPSVAKLSSDIGISNVTFNTINNTTNPQGVSAYLDFTKDPSQSTNIARGASYTLSVSRNASTLYSAINRDAFIDWNQDGSFSGPGETVAQDSNSKSLSFSQKVTVPASAALGATIMRVAVNLYLYPNTPCGPNLFGEYEDYRVFVTPYNILPVITLKGTSGLNDTIKLEQGQVYNDPGDSASSYLYGDITKDIKVTSKVTGGSSAFSNMVPGIYVFSYDVTDSAGNKAVTKYRVVWVTKDKTPPDLKVKMNSATGGDTIYQEVSTTGPVQLNPSLDSYIISSIDLVDGNVTTGVIVDASLVNTAVVGIYPVTYTSSDYSSPPNTVIVTRYVDVIDTIKPLLTLRGTTPYKVEVNIPYVDPGVIISVANNYLTPAKLAPDLVVTNNVDVTTLGTYTVTYNLTDTFGNVAATVVRTVIVGDLTPPVITLYGNLNDSIPVNNQFIDPGYSVSDNYTKTSDIKFSVGGTFYSTFSKGFADKLGGGGYAGTNGIGPVYTIVYTATDASNNVTTVTRNVEVYDNIAPKINLIGSPFVAVCRWFPYADLGYTLSDNYEKAGDWATDTADGCGIDTVSDMDSTGGTNVPENAFYVKYIATDQSHNSSSVTRYISVKSDGEFPCTSGIEPNLALDKYITIFPNPSSGIFTVDANLPMVENVRISVVNMLGQEVAVVHNGNLSNNSFRVDLSTQSSGVYFLNIVTDNQTLTKRIEITK